MSTSCAESLGIMQLVDKRFQSVLGGIGEANVVGRVRDVQIKVGSLLVPYEFAIVDGNQPDFLLGLEFLSRYRTCIDFNKGALIIRGVELPFLSEAERRQMKNSPRGKQTVVDPPSRLSIPNPSVMSSKYEISKPRNLWRGHSQDHGVPATLPTTNSATTESTPSSLPESIAKRIRWPFGRNK